jgi:putative DNA methylase
VTRQTIYPKRLIEVALPIKRISEHARPEKTTVHGNISTLHIWWARRPHAACRAVLCASLWLDPADPNCPLTFRQTAGQSLKRFADEAVRDKKLAASCSHDTWRRWQVFSQAKDFDAATEPHANMLRFLLLEFIADFSKWENQAEPNYLRTAREITH